MSLIHFREIETWSMFHRVRDRHFLSAGNGWVQAACYVALGLGGILACPHKATPDPSCCPASRLGPHTHVWLPKISSRLMSLIQSSLPGSVFSKESRKSLSPLSVGPRPSAAGGLRRSKVRSAPLGSEPWKGLEVWPAEGKLPASRAAGVAWPSPATDRFKAGSMGPPRALGLSVEP